MFNANKGFAVYFSMQKDLNYSFLFKLSKKIYPQSQISIKYFNSKFQQLGKSFPQPNMPYKK